MDYKPLIIEQLTILFNERKNQNKIWSAKAYGKVIDILKNTDKKLYKFEDIEDIQGIGKGVKDKIKEIFDNGFIEEIKNLSNEDFDKNNIIEELTKIPNIGVKKAQELYNKGIRTIDDLYDKQELLNDNQIIGLKYYKDVNKRIPRNEMDKHYTFIKEVVEGIDENIIFELAGSYRRLLNDSGDIDVLITKKVGCNLDGEEIFKNIVDTLIKGKYIKDYTAYGKKKFMGYCRLKKHKLVRRIDILYTEPEQYPFALMYFTGDYEFNIVMRNIAISKGLTLNEYGLFDTSGKNVSELFYTEEDIFRYLELDYTEPKDRNKNSFSKTQDANGART